MTANMPAQANGTIFSKQDFLTFGLNDVAYIRQINSDDGTPKFAIHAADGTEIVVIDHLGQAIATIHNNDLEVASIH